jgi:hypothetical protein
MVFVPTVHLMAASMVLVADWPGGQLKIELTIRELGDAVRRRTCTSMSIIGEA